MEITSQAIAYNSRIIPIRNVASAEMVERQVDMLISDLEYKARRKWHLKAGVVVFGIGIVLFYLAGITNRPIILLSSILLLLMGVATVFIGLARPTRKSWEYGVSLQMNSGSVDLLWLSTAE